MASMIAHEVFSEIVDIARSDEPLRRRRARAEKRIAQFKADLKAAFFMSPTRGRLSKNHVIEICGRHSTVRGRHPING
jgi:hypothetical protein